LAFPTFPSASIPIRCPPSASAASLSIEQAEQLGVLLAREQETVAELRELDRLKSDFAAAASH
jgi:hypothetical protein